MKRDFSEVESKLGRYLQKITDLTFENVDWDRKEIEWVRDFLSPWNHNIKLAKGIYTAFCEDYYAAHREIMCVLSNELKGDFSNKRILDVGCLEGYFSAECALQGANVLGIDGKIVNIRKCEFVRSVLNLKNVRFVKDDAMRINKKRYGSFDIVLALGIVYHLEDPFRFLSNIFSLCRGFVLIDTRVARSGDDECIEGEWKPDLSSLKKFRFGKKIYYGRLYREHAAGTPQIAKDFSCTASLRNSISVWLTEDSLISMLRDVGFEQISKMVYARDERTWWNEGRMLILARKKRVEFRSKMFGVG